MSRTLETIATREALESRVDDLELVDDLVEDLGVGVVVYDQDALVERANQKFADAVGRDREDLPGTFVWDVLEAREPTTFEDHWAAVEPDEPTTETATVGGTERELVTTRVEAEGEPYNVTMVVEADDEAAMDPEFAEMLSYEFHHWFDLAREAMGEARETGDVERLEVVDEIVERMQDAIETEVTTVTEPDAEWATEPLLLGEVAGVAWNHVLGEAGSHEVRGGQAVLAHRGLLLRLFEHLFRTLLQYAEGGKTAIDVGLTAGGFYVEDDGAGVPHAERGYAADDESPTDTTHGAGILVARRAASRMDWDVAVTENDDGGTRVEVTGVTFVTEAE